jgi:hypothetical protein
MKFDILKPVQKALADNSAAILTGVGVVGTVTTAVLASRATVKAVRALDEYETMAMVNNEDSNVPPQALSPSAKVMMVGHYYLPAISSGITTITAVLFSYKISSKQSAAFAAAYGISEKAFQEYKDKVVEKVGSKKETTITEALAQDRVNANPLGDREVIVIGAGDVLCYDELSGRYFRSSIEAIKAAENKINHEILNQNAVSLGTFYDELGLQPTALDDQLGWNLDNLLDVAYSAVLADNGQPCISIGFRTEPIPNYHRPLYG